ncbi:MAG: class I SAM-dependent methyltransferase [Gemmataceae bacterium]
MSRTVCAVAFTLVLVPASARCQDKSVRPGINDPFRDPDVKKFVETFEGESREIFVHRDRVVTACGLKPGMVVADIGAGTGLYTRLFARAVGPDGQVYAVDIAGKFLEHVRKTSRDAGLRNVTPVLCNDDAVDLPPHSIDLAFICDTYHHFEFPARTVDSIRRALRPGGRLIVIDFERIPGKSRDWVLGHVRAGREVVEREIGTAGFRKTNEVGGIFEENYFTIFTRQDDAGAAGGKRGGR